MKETTHCSICFADLPPSPETFALSDKHTLTLCSACTDQANQIQTNTGSSRKAAITYMFDLILRALTGSALKPTPAPNHTNPKTQAQT